MFSVIIPYYNKSAYIIRCIDSVLSQTYKEYEVLIIDDGSTDGGINLISKKYGQHLSIITQKNQGVSVARNHGIQKAKNEYLAFLDADDAWHPQYLECMSKIISSEQNIKIIGSHYARTTDFLYKKINRPHYYKFLNYFNVAIRNTYFTSSSSVIKKTFFDEYDGFNPNLKKGEDHDVWFRAILSGGNAYYIKDTLVYYSDEDIHQITKSSVALDNDLVANINTLYKSLKASTVDKNFKKFISLYVYFNLYPYYYEATSKEKARTTLKENEYCFFLLHLVYALPFNFGQKLIKSDTYRHCIRLYLKFIIRFYQIQI